MDNEKQKDEIVALESIYNKEEFSYREVEERYECTLKIFIRLPDGYHLDYKDIKVQEQQITEVPISHLPPLELHISMPEDYPSKSPPKFTLCCSWLQHSMLSKLCRKLDELWKENAEQEIIFTWIAFLQDETLNYLNIQDYLDVSRSYSTYLENMEKKREVAENKGESKIGSEGNVGSGQIQKPQTTRKTIQKRRWRKQNNRRPIDSRAFVNRSINTNPVQLLVDYNEKRTRIEFKKNFYKCNICFNEKSGEQSTEFTPCKHVFCKECIHGYLTSKITDGNVKNICCPEDKCTSEATPGQVKDLVSADMFARYDSILLSVTLETLNDIIYCPRRHCQYPVSREPDEKLANCPACRYAFCVDCKMVYHGIEPCKMNSDEKQKILAEYQEASPERKIEMERLYGKKQLQSLVDNAMTQNWITNNSRHCPHCNATIEKSGGCNKMTCGRCKTYFCWTCGVRLNPETPYTHYKDPNSRCFNMLFVGLVDDEEDEDDVEIIFLPFSDSESESDDEDYDDDL